MSKPLAIVKAAAAGVTALYHAVEAADHSTRGEGTQAYEAAVTYKNARADFIEATDVVLAKRPEGRDIPIARTGDAW